MGSIVDVQPQYPVEVSAYGRVEDKNVTWKRSVNGENGSMTIVNAREMKYISQEYQRRMMSGDTSLIMPIIAYYGTGRLQDYIERKKKILFEKALEVMDKFYFK